MHEARQGGEATVAAVRLVVPELRARGYELVTASAAITSQESEPQAEAT
jgi:hypothetical protein